MTGFCVVCKTEISPKRYAHGSFYCSEACRLAYRKARRNWRSSRYCRLCGRDAKKPKPVDPVSQGHTPTPNLVEGKF
jgi:predicted nucleic acid-binding Zn ribbon protein